MEYLQEAVLSLREKFDNEVNQLKFHYQKENFLLNKKGGAVKKYHSIIRKFLFLDKEIPENIQNIVSKILSDSVQLYQSLFLLYSLDIPFGLSLVGGGARDLLLGNEDHIKDLDILLTVDWYAFSKMNKNKLNEKLQVIGFQIPSDWEDTQRVRRNRKYYKMKIYSTQYRLYKIVEYILSQNFSLGDVYPPRQNSKQENYEEEPKMGNYINKLLQGVIKINDKKLNYPIDILISSHSAHHFIDVFDFGLCKAGFEIVHYNAYKNRQFYFPQTVRQFLYYYLPNREFLSDIINKTHTMYLDFREINDIKISIDNHLPRLVSKYPDYRVKFSYYMPAPAHNDNLYNQKMSIVNHYHLENCIPIKHEHKANKVKKI